jgi:hypothetical protein
MPAAAVMNPETTALSQSASAVLTIRPAHFGWNPDTGASNRFQRHDPALALRAVELARAEADGLAQALRAAAVEVHAFDDLPEPRCPDAVFPNNWVSLHHDGSIVLYPMLAPSRRPERRLDVIHALATRAGRRVSRLVDLTGHEAQARFLEGTGSVVFDHAARRAYACLSPRTHPAPLHELCGELGYTPHPFRAFDGDGAPIYHTNVLLAIGTRFAVIADRAVEQDAREGLLTLLAEGGRQVVRIDGQQLAGFAGNVLEVEARDGSSVLAMSRRAADAFGEAELERLHGCVDRVVVADVPTIETLGGGSVRCMLAEVFLPR